MKSQVNGSEQYLLFYRSRKEIANKRFSHIKRILASNWVENKSVSSRFDLCNSKRESSWDGISVRVNTP